MTRWARGGPANKKKPLPATPWDQMTSSQMTQNKNDDTSRPKQNCKSDLHKTKKSKHEMSSKKNKTSTTKTGERKSKSRPAAAIDGNTLIVEEIEKIKRSEEDLGKEDVRMLDEMVRKAARSEQRRVKRIRTKEQAKVGFLSCSVAERLDTAGLEVIVVGLYDPKPCQDAI